MSGGSPAGKGAGVCVPHDHDRGAPLDQRLHRACAAAASFATVIAAVTAALSQGSQPQLLCALAVILSWNLCPLAYGVCWRAGAAPALAGAAQWVACNLLLMAAAAWSGEAGSCRQSDGLRLGWAALLSAAGTPLAVSYLRWGRRMRVDACGAASGGSRAGSFDKSAALQGPDAAPSSSGGSSSKGSACCAPPSPCAGGMAMGLASSTPTAAVRQQLLDRLHAQRAVAARRPAQSSSLYSSSSFVHATAVAKVAPAEGHAGDPAACADLAAVAPRICRGALAASAPVQVSCVIFPGCVSVAAQVTWHADAAVPGPQAFAAALQQHLGAEAGTQLLAAALETSGGQVAPGCGGCWCATPVVASSSCEGLQAQLVLPEALCASLLGEGVSLRMVAAHAGAASVSAAVRASRPLLDITVQPQEVLAVQLPACSGPLVTLHLLRTTAPATANGRSQEQPPLQAPGAGAEHSQEQLLASVPLLVLPSEAACGEVMGLWSSMVTQWRDAHPEQPLDQASTAEQSACPPVHCPCPPAHHPCPPVSAPACWLPAQPPTHPRPRRRSHPARPAQTRCACCLQRPAPPCTCPSSPPSPSTPPPPPLGVRAGGRHGVRLLLVRLFQRPFAAA
jgi:hypothetical protein